MGGGGELLNTGYNAHFFKLICYLNSRDHLDADLFHLAEFRFELCFFKHFIQDRNSVKKINFGLIFLTWTMAMFFFARHCVYSEIRVCKNKKISLDKQGEKTVKSLESVPNRNTRQATAHLQSKQSEK